MITKKQLSNEIAELFSIAQHHNDMLYALQNKISRLEQIAEMESPTKSQLRAKKAMKIKVKGTPGRPKKIEVKIKRSPGRPRKNVQPRTKDGKFAKKK